MPSGPGLVGRRHFDQAWPEAAGGAAQWARPARIIEPVSKLERLRVLAEAGWRRCRNATLKRRLRARDACAGLARLRDEPYVSARKAPSSEDSDSSRGGAGIAGLAASTEGGQRCC